MIKKLYKIPKISLNIEKVKNDVLKEVTTIPDVIKALQSEIPEEELNHKNSTWALFCDYKGTSLAKKEIIGIARLSDSDIFLNRLHCKEFLQLMILSNAGAAILLYNRPQSKIYPDHSERISTKNLKDISEFMDVFLWDVVIMNTETYHAYI